MLRFSKNIFLVALLFAVVIGTPIYAVLKIIVPSAIVQSLESHLPDGISLRVGTVFSKPNLEIVYEDVQIWSESFSLIIPQLTLKPVINVQRPLFLMMDQAIFETNTVKLIAKHVDARLKVDGFKAQEFSIEGEFEEIGAVEKALISQGNFIIAGLNSPSKELDINAQKIEVSLKVPAGLLNLELVNSQHVISLNDIISVQTLIEEASAVLAQDDNQSYPSTFSGKSVRLQASLDSKISQENWVLPIDLIVKNIAANKTYIFDQLDLKATAKWRASDPSTCRLAHVLSRDKICGRLTDVVGVKVKLDKGLEGISFEGDGYCVAPRSGCRQKINSRIESRKTEQVFSRVLKSEAFNPFIVSILMGVLLSSPAINSEYSHSADLDVSGSQVLVNQKPLF